MRCWNLKLQPSPTSSAATGSPLIDMGANCPAFDQRFAVRFNTCDIGAIEAGGLTARSRLPMC